MKKIPFTKDAYQKMVAEFDRLTKERAEVMIRLKIARDMGDLSENGAYHYAKFELGSIGRQLRELKHLIENGEVVETPGTSDVIDFGSTVTLSTGKRELTVMMVSKHESNPKENKLSTDSPIGQAIIGKKVGQKVMVEIPAGKVEYSILKVA